MLENIQEPKARKEEKSEEFTLSNPFSRGFETLLHLKQGKDAGLILTLESVRKRLPLKEATVRSHLNDLVRGKMARKTKEKTYLITKKGEQYLFDSILPIFSKQQKIVGKIFFRKNLTRGDLILQDKLKCLENAFNNLILNSLPWFKKWLGKEFGEYMAFEDWFLVFEKEHVEFLKQQLEQEKNNVTKHNKR